jgi:2-polyprenyl-6-hydroxyphenyl methylase/3-demethylubiquinone-9 3-methyltransferase
MLLDPQLTDYGWSQDTSHTVSESSAQQRSSVLHLGCGNGGADPSASGIAQACHRLGSSLFHQASAEPEQLAQLHLPALDLVLSREVVEQVYTPRQWAPAAYSALKTGGLLICSTSYHGDIKNLALAASGMLDMDFTALWDGGYIKFWFRRTLTALLQEAGFQVVALRAAGR